MPPATNANPSAPPYPTNSTECIARKAVAVKYDAVSRILAVVLVPFAAASSRRWTWLHIRGRGSSMIADIHDESGWGGEGLDAEGDAISNPGCAGQYPSKPPTRVNSTPRPCLA
jgi:hypothetical protein